ncbi:hypothetical protein HY311_03900 [Candidatus Nomurabacteria bacterium]|nr:hypothetical protein [Candidatus Nomurabacteria bacterium]
MKKNLFWIILVLLIIIGACFFFPGFLGGAVSYKKSAQVINTSLPEVKANPITSNKAPLDVIAYDKKLNEIANNPPDPIIYTTVKTPGKDKNGKAITITTKVPLDPQPVKTHLWPVKTVYPNAGALLPFNRIVAYYGNLYSTKMGVLGEYPEAIMLEKLEAEVKKWEIADPTTPVIPALHYIAVVAQGAPGDSGKYRLRMPGSEIDKVLAMAGKINAIVFLDIQVGFSNVQTEIPLLEKYLKLPNVHLAIDPEFSMKTGIRPGKVVGTLDAADINFAANYLANLVKENNLTPKILIIHRYTQKMVTNYKLIKPLPEVQFIMNMDGWGGEAKKIGTYKNFIYPEPVQFTGFKLFYKNDILTPGTTLMTPTTLLKLNPQPIYIQYQ